jgi:MerR family transcriptional regulator, redox-sensitive transcriptional activator SoxR
MTAMTIGEVARRSGLRPSAIRYYEALGLLPKPPRTGGRRRYDDDVLKRLAMVRFAKHVGFSMEEVKLLLDGVNGRPPTERWRKLARAKAKQVAEFIAHATTVQTMLLDTLSHQCPKLVERGNALPTRKPSLSLRVRSARAKPSVSPRKIAT